MCGPNHKFKLDGVGIFMFQSLSICNDHVHTCGRISPMENFSSKIYRILVIFHISRRVLKIKIPLDFQDDQEL